MSKEMQLFENRWASENQGRHWLLRLEREGEPNVRAMYADHELHSPEQHLLFEGVPVGFARDWLAWRDNEKRQRRRSRHRVIVGLLILITVLIALLALWEVSTSG